MRKITVDEIMEHNPCEDWTWKMVAKKIGKGKTLLEISRLRGVEDGDKIWCITRFMSDEQNRGFAIWCARQCKTDVPEIGAHIDAIEAFYFGEGTEEEMQAAYGAAYSAAYGAADWAADSAADWAAERRKQIKKLRELLEGKE